MSALKKTENSLQEPINEYQTSCISAGAVPANADTAGDLIEALDSLLLEKALREYRVAQARLKTLKQALGKS